MEGNIFYSNIATAYAATAGTQFGNMATGSQHAMAATGFCGANATPEGLGKAAWAAAAQSTAQEAFQDQCARDPERTPYSSPHQVNGAHAPGHAPDAASDYPRSPLTHEFGPPDSAQRAYTEPGMVYVDNKQGGKPTSYRGDWDAAAATTNHGIGVGTGREFTTGGIP